MQGEFRISRRVAFCETDLAGVMHFSNYLRWMEDVEHAFWRSLGLSVHTPYGDGAVSWPRVAVSCDYFAPVHFEDEVEMRLRIEKIGEKSLSMSVEFHKGGQRVARATETAVFAREHKGRFESAPIPADVRARLDQFISGPGGG